MKPTIKFIFVSFLTLCVLNLTFHSFFTLLKITFYIITYMTRGLLLLLFYTINSAIGLISPILKATAWAFGFAVGSQAGCSFFNAATPSNLSAFFSRFSAAAYPTSSSTSTLTQIPQRSRFFFFPPFSTSILRNQVFTPLSPHSGCFVGSEGRLFCGVDSGLIKHTPPTHLLLTCDTHRE